MTNKFIKNTIYLLIQCLLACLLLHSCNQKDEPEIVKMKLNHYLLPTINGQSDQKFIFLYQEEDEIGTNTWNELDDTIVNLHYEWGHIYEIYVRKAKIINSSKKIYVLENEINKTAVPPNTKFTLPIAEHRNNIYYTHVIKKNTPYFYLKDSIPVNCGEHYEELNTKLQEQLDLNGTFIHGKEGEINLIEMIQL